MVKVSDLKLKAMHFTKGIDGAKKARDELMKTKREEEIESLMEKIMRIAD